MRRFGRAALRCPGHPSLITSVPSGLGGLVGASVAQGSQVSRDIDGVLAQYLEWHDLGGKFVGTGKDYRSGCAFHMGS
jgi:hypothetical protein